MASEEDGLEARMALWHRELQADYEGSGRRKLSPMVERLEALKRAQLRGRAAEEDDESVASGDVDRGSFYALLTKGPALEKQRGVSEEKERAVDDATQERLWVRRFSPLRFKDKRKRLFLLCDIRRVCHLASLLEDVAEIFLVVAPGRRHRATEKLSTDISRLGREARAALKDLFSDRDYVLFGHGLGALVAYELLRHQQNAGGPMPTTLIVSGCKALTNFTALGDDSAPKNNSGPLTERSDLELLCHYFGKQVPLSPATSSTVVDNINDDTKDDNTKDEFFETARDLRIRQARAEKTQSEERRRFCLATLPPALHSKGLRDEVASAIRSDCRLLEDYRHVFSAPLDCGITVVVAGEDDRAHDLHDWQAETTRAFRLFPAPADYLNEGRGAHLADLLRATLLEEDHHATHEPTFLEHDDGARSPFL